MSKRDRRRGPGRRARAAEARSDEFSSLIALAMLEVIETQLAREAPEALRADRLARDALARIRAMA
jgi:hypothetical protein